MPRVWVRDIAECSAFFSPAANLAQEIPYQNMSIVSKDRVETRDSSFADVSDESLLQRYCQTADRSAFEELVQRYHRELYSYLRRYLGDAAMAEDAFQTTFLRMHLKC